MLAIIFLVEQKDEKFKILTRTVIETLIVTSLVYHTKAHLCR